MEIISRSKKEILWHGLPNGHGNALERARADKICLSAQIEKQQSYLQVYYPYQQALNKAYATVSSCIGSGIVLCDLRWCSCMLPTPEPPVVLLTHLCDDMLFQATHAWIAHETQSPCWQTVKCCFWYTLPFALCDRCKQILLLIPGSHCQIVRAHGSEGVLMLCRSF